MMIWFWYFSWMLYFQCSKGRRFWRNTVCWSTNMVMWPWFPWRRRCVRSMARIYRIPYVWPKVRRMHVCCVCVGYNLRTRYWHCRHDSMLKVLLVDVNIWPLWRTNWEEKDCNFLEIRNLHRLIMITRIKNYFCNCPQGGASSEACAGDFTLCSATSMKLNIRKLIEAKWRIYMHQ